MTAVTERDEQKRLDVPGIGDVVATITHRFRADGSVHLTELKGAMRYPRGASLTDAELKRVADALHVFY